MDSFIVVETERLRLLEEIEDHFLLLRDVADEYAVATTDAAGHILEWSPRAEEIFGVPREEAHGLPFAFMYTANTRNACSFAAAMGQASYRGRHNHECWLQTKRGDRFKARVSIEPVEHEPGLPHGYLVVIKVLTPDMVPPSHGVASHNLRLFHEISDETDRQEVGHFFATQTSTYLDDLHRALAEQDVRASEELSRQLEKLFLCLGCEPMARVHAQVQAYIRHQDWSSAQQSLAAMRAMMEEEVI